MKPTKKDTKARSGAFKSDPKKVQIIQFLNIGDNSLHPNCVVSVDEPIFQPEPSTILFEDYEPLQSLTKILKLRNRDIVPRRVSIIHPENRLFQVYPYITSKGGNSKAKHGFWCETYFVTYFHSWGYLCISAFTFAMFCF